MRFALLAGLLPQLALVLVAAPEPAGAQCTCAVADVVSCGHRGTGVNDPDNPFPENTLPSFRQAEAEGAQRVELDVHHSADGVLVVHHDPAVDDTTDGSGCIGALTLAELRALDAAATTGLAGTGVTIPTLDEVLAAVTVEVNVEIKVQEGGDCPPSDRARLAADVVATIHDDPSPARIVVSSFDEAVLAEVERLDATVHTSLLSSRADAVDVAAAGGFDGVNLFVVAASPEAVAAARAAGLDVGVWTVDDADEIRGFLDLGVDVVISDEPDLVEATRRAWCEASGCPFVPPTTPPGPPATSGDDGGCAVVAGAPARGSRLGLAAVLGLLAWTLARRAEGARGRRGARARQRAAGRPSSADGAPDPTRRR